MKTKTAIVIFKIFFICWYAMMLVLAVLAVFGDLPKIRIDLLLACLAYHALKTIITWIRL